MLHGTPQDLGLIVAGYLSRFVGIVPVLAIQGGGYVVAGLVMLVHLRDGRQAGDEPAELGRRALAAAR